MRYLVGYDISDDTRREKIATLLADYGDRVQYSLFEADLAPEALATLADELHSLPLGPADSIRIYRLCAGCSAASHTIGAGTLRQTPLAWIA